MKTENIEDMDDASFWAAVENEILEVSRKI